MPRPRTTRAPEHTDAIAAANVDHAALAAAGDAAAWQSQQLALIKQRYDIGMPYDFDSAVMRLRECAAIETSGAVEAGLVLLHIKAHTPGRFYEALETAGVNDRWARKRMQVVIRLKDFPSLRALGFTKALELLSEDDDTLEGLEAGGTVAGLTLDEIDRMSVRELRTTLRAERAERSEEKAAEAEIVARKDERINALLRDKRRVARSAAREQAGELLEQLDRVSVEVATQVKTLRDTASAIRAVYEEAGESMDEEVADRLQQCGDLAAKWTGQLADELGE